MEFSKNHIVDQEYRCTVKQLKITMLALVIIGFFPFICHFIEITSASSLEDGVSRSSNTFSKSSLNPSDLGVFSSVHRRPSLSISNILSIGMLNRFPYSVASSLMVASYIFFIRRTDQGSGMVMTSDTLYQYC